MNPFQGVVLHAFGATIIVRDFDFQGYLPDSLACLRGAVAGIEVHGAGLRTPEGLGVGSTLGDLRRALGRARIAAPADDCCPAYFGSRRGLAFYLSSVDARLYGEGDPTDSIAHSDSVPDSTRVVAMQISDPRAQGCLRRQ